MIIATIIFLTIAGCGIVIVEEYCENKALKKRIAFKNRVILAQTERMNARLTETEINNKLLSDELQKLRFELIKRETEVIE